MLKPIITLKDIAVSFDGEQVLKNFNLTIGDGEFVTLLGPSGCGKTTVLRTIGGFVTPDSGDVFFGDEKINNVPPHKRAVNTIFQKYALFPHLNVYENIAFGMRLKGKKRRRNSEDRHRNAAYGQLKRHGAPRCRPAFRRSAAACRHCARPRKRAEGAPPR